MGVAGRPDALQCARYMLGNPSISNYRDWDELRWYILHFDLYLGQSTAKALKKVSR
jgi:hypothetical protein